MYTRKHRTHFLCGGKGHRNICVKGMGVISSCACIGLCGQFEGNVYRKFSVVVSPVYSGAGTNIKVLEALAHEKKIVSFQILPSRV